MFPAPLSLGAYFIDMKKAKIIGIYKITSPTGAIYIGQTVDMYLRKVLYKNHHCKSQRRLYNSILKHGWEAHIFEVLIECPEDELDKWEMHYISFYKTFNTDHGMNLRDGSKTRGRQSEETKRKISESHKGIGHTDATKEKLRIINTGRKMSSETIHNMSIAKLGKLKSAETKRRMSIRQLGEKNHLYGKHLSDDHKRKISKANTGRETSQTTREKIRIANTGFVVSAETKQKLREINLGKKASEATRRKISESNKGKIMSEEAKIKIRIGLTGNKNGLGKIPSAEKRKKISLANSGEKNGMYGKKPSVETVAKRVAKLKGQKRTPEQIERMRQGRIAKGGWNVSMEARRKSSESHKLYYRNKKKKDNGTKG